MNNETDIFSSPVILVVDDNKGYVRLIEHYLKDENYSIYSTEDSMEALELAIKLKPDLILLDIMMPKLNGFELCRLIKKSESLKNVPVIFVTIKDVFEDKVEGYKLGAADYITKPFITEEIINKIKTHFALKRYRDYYSSALDI